jgi:predicted GNAT family acetyltransferase
MVIDENDIKDNEFLRQFELHRDGQLARIEYSLQERKIFLTKLDVPDAIKCKGCTEPFMEAVFNIIKERNIRLVPTCSEITSFVRKNRRKYKELLPVGINI